MIFSNNIIRESEEDALEQDDIDIVAGDYDPDSAEGIEAMANEVEQHMTTAALEAVSYFEG